MGLLSMGNSQVAGPGKPSLSLRSVPFESRCLTWLLLSFRFKDYHQRLAERRETTCRSHDAYNILPDGFRPLRTSGTFYFSSCRIFTTICVNIYANLLNKSTSIKVYMGQLRNKCVLEMSPGESETGNWTEWILDSDHWFYNSRGPELCGNASGAR